jgi:hypothetical protein
VIRLNWLEAFALPLVGFCIMSSPSPTQLHPPLVSSIVSPGLQVFLDHPDTKQLLPRQNELANNPRSVPGQRGAAFVCDHDGGITKFTMVAKLAEGRRNSLADYFSLGPVKMVRVEKAEVSLFWTSTTANYCEATEEGPCFSRVFGSRI